MVKDADIKSQVATYGGLIGTMKWGAVAVAAIVAMVIWLIAR
ncbi:aa3-type cytochrome c oxidase subunit IV [Sphingomonas bacterium]|nr:aa3-type cytochrome c oxidase subunit IV [Sphingomonas bacterium]